MKCTAMFANLRSCEFAVQYATCLEGLVLATNGLDINVAVDLAILAPMPIAPELRSVYTKEWLEDTIGRPRTGKVTKESSHPSRFQPLDLIIL